MVKNLVAPEQSIETPAHISYAMRGISPGVFFFIREHVRGDYMTLGMIMKDLLNGARARRKVWDNGFYIVCDDLSAETEPKLHLIDDLVKCRCLMYLFPI